MSALLPVTVSGVQVQAHGEYTSSQVAGEFQNSLAAFVNLFNLGIDGAIDGVNPNSSTLSSDILNKIDATNYETELLNALLGGIVTKNKEVTDPNRPPEQVQVVGLLNLLHDGLNVVGDPVLQPGVKYLSLEMAGALDQLLRSLQMAGVNIQNVGGRLTVVGGITKTQIKTWRNLAATSDAIRKIMQYAVDTTGNQNRTLQALVELIYVRTGNELLSESLERLENDLSATKASLDLLNRLQTLHNKVTAEDKVKFASTYYFWPGYTFSTTKLEFTVRPFPFPPTLTTRNYNTVRSIYTPTIFVFAGGLAPAADAFFKGLDPRILGDITDADRIEFLNLRNSVFQEIGVLSGQGADSSPGTLLDNLRKVLGDINRAFSAVGISAGIFNQAGQPTTSAVAAALTRWLLDSNMVESANLGLNINGSPAGQIQRNLSSAISSGQSLNDTQKEEVRRYLFVFEEYYKSAAAVLTKITQILERMAQAISR